MLESKSITKYYGNICAANEVSFAVEEGQFVTLLGPSGCGKSTLLHIIAGLTQPTDGEIFIRSKNMTGNAPEERRIGMVFQNTALFPHMSVENNIKYGLKLHNYDEEEIEGRIEELLELVQLSDHKDHKPNELSGGQKQRVALIRALAYEPDILLLDEPLTGLDRVLREEMRREIDRVQEEVGVTTLYVTHDQEEALSMSDKVVVLNDGEIEQEGTSSEIYNHPKTKFVAEFVGRSNKFEGKVSAPSQLHIESSGLVLEIEETETREGDEACAYVRPEDINLYFNSKQKQNEFKGKIIEIEELGNHAEIEISLNSDGENILAETGGFPSFDINNEIIIQFSAEDVIIL